MKKHKKKKRTLKEKLKYYIFSKQNVFVWLFKIIIGLFRKPSIYRAQGTHFISAYPGMGKTLLMNKLIQDTDKEKYFFLSNMKEFDGVQQFNISDIFKDNTQVKQFPLLDQQGRQLYGVIFDEINLSFNKRLNRKSDYNDLFIGLIEFLVSHRHQGVPRVYFIGQKLELQDTQLISLFKYQHDIIRCKRFPFYWFYKEYNVINYIPRKLHIVNRVKSIDNDFIELNLDKVKIIKRDLQTYNTKALANNYENLPFVETK